ncbi:MAG: hypothetical protein J6Y02_03800 [Pseudobutyrivibrio sp.]|nr:hypothetical protein [Pseudobutyrivibrio sp.]
MTKEEQNQIIKDAWVRNLQKEGDIPESISLIYENWVLSLIQKVSSQLKPQPEDETQDKENNKQEGQNG